jgi:hypothetical protein
MENSTNKSRLTGQPDLSDLFARFLQAQVGSHKAGLGLSISGEVVPFEAAPAQPADPKLAWEESLAVLPFYSSKFIGGAQSPAKTLKAPPDWPALVAAQEPAVALPFCLGNFPQMVRSLQPLLNLAQGTSATRFAASGGHPSRLTNPSAPPFGSLELSRWAEQNAKKKHFPDSLLAVAALRVARDIDRAESLIPDSSKVDDEFHSACENERAALAWHRGQMKEANSSWQGQKESVPVLFNRGMASLFLGHCTEARDSLQKAIGHLSEDSAWHHLARLYLALADM